MCQTNKTVDNGRGASPSFESKSSSKQIPDKERKSSPREREKRITERDGEGNRQERVNSETVREKE